MTNIGWISNPQELIDFIKMRNETSHRYKEDVAQAVHAASVSLANSWDELIKVHKEKTK